MYFNMAKKLIVFSAPSGSGKTTIVRHLLKQKELNLSFSISATSRASRGQEKNGKDYYFLTEKEFKKKIKEDAFIEWEEVYRGTHYGTLKAEVERLWSEGKNIIFDIDVVGGLNIKKQFPNETLAIFVKPPSIEVMEQRLRNRKTDSEEKIKERVAKATKEMEFAEKFDTILVNDILEESQKEAYQLVRKFIEQ